MSYVQAFATVVNEISVVVVIVCCGGLEAEGPGVGVGQFERNRWVNFTEIYNCKPVGSRSVS